MSVGWDSALHGAWKVTRWRAPAAGFGVGAAVAGGVGARGEEPPHPIRATNSNEGKAPDRSIFNSMPSPTTVNGSLFPGAGHGATARDGIGMHARMGEPTAKTNPPGLWTALLITAVVRAVTVTPP